MCAFGLPTTRLVWLGLLARARQIAARCCLCAGAACRVCPVALPMRRAVRPSCGLDAENPLRRHGALPCGSERHTVWVRGLSNLSSSEVSRVIVLFWSGMAATRVGIGCKVDQLQPGKSIQSLVWEGASVARSQGCPAGPSPTDHQILLARNRRRAGSTVCGISSQVASAPDLTLCLHACDDQSPPVHAGGFMLPR